MDYLKKAQKATKTLKDTHKKWLKQVARVFNFRKADNERLYDGAWVEFKSKDPNNTKELHILIHEQDCSIQANIYQDSSILTSMTSICGTDKGIAKYLLSVQHFAKQHGLSIPDRPNTLGIKIWKGVK